ncbi:TetR/AcrR family transcriptional regulator [Cryptosporangium phraense]|uniref:TetR/AcrR family transcriptional regulator n=1 Tax=Cryptosporangium phraense TaxID=2593070 RepID=A0A545AQF7_9ACTN|nr:TetR/AcrR family transcriptional regulator [Cryptosporangium phraense]TQS43562.1 TetR/AcrR family transcriptional regulator [Cryptosporangium phraense]
MTAGRKRSEESRSAILTGAVELVREIGYGRLTIEGIAARAGVGKQTIYRWWPSRADVLFEALATHADLEISADDHGSYRADLRAFLSESFALAEASGVAEILRPLMAEAQLDPAFGDRFRDAFLTRRRAALRRVLDRAAERGDLPAQPPPDLVIDVVFGVLWYRVLATREPLVPTLADELTELLAPAASPAPGAR